VDATLSHTTQDAHAQLSRAILEIREALRAPLRTKARIRDSLGRFAEIAQSQFQNEDGRCLPKSRVSAIPAAAHSDELTAEHTAVLEKLQTLCILARSGVETTGWWNTVERQFDELACLVSGQEGDGKEPPHGESCAAVHAVA
jgi:hypothetical protein